MYDLPAIIRRNNSNRIALPLTYLLNMKFTAILGHYIIKRLFTKSLQVVDFYFYVFMYVIQLK